MSQSHTFEKTNTDTSGRSFTINLILDGPSDIWIRSCEVVGHGVRNRFSFSDSRRIEDVLEHRLAQAVTHSVRKVPHGTHVLCLPDEMVELPGLVLAGAQVMITKVTETVLSVMVRFKEFVGAVNRAFVIDVGCEDTIAPHADRLALNVLEDVCMPLLNLCQTVEDLIDKQGYVPSLQYTNAAGEFRFQAELLKRYAARSGMFDRFGIPEDTQHHDAPPRRLPQ